jgi:hypothetical protein
MREMPAPSQDMQLLGRGTNAVVLRDPVDKAVYKIGSSGDPVGKF